MKKIVALVLALALALSLCTVAMAVTNHRGSTKLDAEDYEVVLMYGNLERESLTEDDELYFYAETKSTTTNDGKTTVTVYPAYYEVELASGTDFVESTWVSVDSSIAMAKLVKNGKVVDYVAPYALNPDDGVSDVVTKKVAGKDDDAVCGEYVHDVYVIDGTAYLAGSFDAEDGYENCDGGFALLNGKVVAYGDEATVENEELIGHVFVDDGDTKLTVKDGVVTAAYCYNCEKNIAVVKASKVAADDAGKYEVAVGVTDVSDNVYVYLDSAATTAADTTTVDSSKTFDAGVAMYVGLSLMSVAGSAVVIGKKKEF